MSEDEELDLHQEPLKPFSLFETIRSVPVWGLSLAHLGGWLGAFIVADKTVMEGARYDAWGKFVCRRVTGLAGIKVVQHGLEKLDPAGSYIFCINHVSLLDLFVVFQSIPYFHRSFQDESHFKIPVYGGCITVFGQVPVRRRDKEFNARAFEQAAEMIRSGDSFVVFPEGHRTRDGRLGTFYPGGFRLAAQAGVPVVPMALKGLRNVCPAGDWRIRPGRVDVIFGEPIPHDAGDAEELARLARAALNDILAGPVPSR
jgi:1-acyl-sn-glycerol-3-phosphate acyltransferase